MSPGIVVALVAGESGMGLSLGGDYGAPWEPRSDAGEKQDAERE